MRREEKRTQRTTTLDIGGTKVFVSAIDAKITGSARYHEFESEWNETLVTIRDRTSPYSDIFGTYDDFDAIVADITENGWDSKPLSYFKALWKELRNDEE